MSQQGSRLDTWRVKLFHSLALKLKGLWRWFKSGFGPPFAAVFAAFPDWLLASVQLDLFTFTPCSLVRGTQAGLWQLLWPLDGVWETSTTPSFFLAKRFSGDFFDSFCCCSTEDIPGWSSPRAIVCFCIPSFSPGTTLVCTLPALTLLSAGTPGSCAAELGSGQKGCPSPCCSSACAGHQALLAAMSWWHSQVPDKICVKTICCFLQESEGSEFGPDDAGKSFLGCWEAF